MLHCQTAPGLPVANAEHPKRFFFFCKRVLCFVFKAEPILIQTEGMLEAALEELEVGLSRNDFLIFVVCVHFCLLEEKIMFACESCF